MAITVPNVVKVTGSGVTTVTTSGVATTTGSTFTISSTADAGVTINTPTDSKSNVYGALGASQTDDLSEFRQSVFYKENGAGGAGHTATITYSGSTYPTAYFTEVAGAAVASYDSGSLAAATDNNGSPHDVTSGTFAQANNAVLTWCGVGGGGTRAYSISGFTATEETDGANYWTGATAYKLVTATTAQLASWVESSTRGLMKIVAFKEAAGGGPTSTTATAAAGVATVSGVGASTARTTDAAAAGVATVSAVGSSAARATATAAAGTATVSAVGAAVIVSTATAAAGVATVSAAGSSIAATSGQAAGAATVSGAGASTARAAGSASGTATVSGAGASTAAIATTPAAGSATVSAVGSSVAAGQTTAIPAEGVATVSAEGSSIVTTTAVPAQGSSEVSATTPTTGGGGYDSKAKVRKRVNELNKKILQAEALEEAQSVQVAVTKAKSVKKSADQGYDEDEDEALMLLL